MFSKVVFPIILVITAAVLINYSQTYNTASEPDEVHLKNNGLAFKFQEDIQELRKNGFISNNWDEIQKIDIKGAEENIYENHIKLIAESIKINTNGKYSLELQPIPSSDDQDLPKLIVQMSLFEISTSNKVWEISRQYKIDGPN
jgi:hypothetical protein